MSIVDWSVLPVGDPLGQPVHHPLLGRQVTVTYARAGEYRWHAYCGQPEPERWEADQAATGTLLRLNAGGDAHLQTGPDTELWVWPVLEIEPAPVT